MSIKPKSSALVRKQPEWLLLILVLALMGAFFVFILAKDDERVQTTERDRLNVLKNVLADNIETNLAATNRALEGVVKDYLTGSDKKGGTPDVSRRLRALSDTMLGIRGMVVLDASGQTIAANQPDVIGQNYSHRDYFKTVRDHPSQTTLYVSAPFKSAKGDLVVAVARMVPGPGGDFAGVVVASLDPQYFTSIFRPLVYAPDVWGAVAHGDGLQLMNFPEKAGLNGSNLDRPGTFFSRHFHSGQIDSILTGMVYTTGEQRLMALRTIQPGYLAMDKALVIGVSRRRDVMAQPWQRQILTYGLFYAVLTLLACSGLYWSQKRRSQIAALDADRERDRREADARMKAAQRLAGFGNWAWDIASDTHTWSEEIFHIYGRDPALPPAVYPEVQQYFTPQSWTALAAAVETALASGVPYEVDAEVVRPDGCHRWIAARGHASRDADGKVVSMQGTVQDITEKKRLDLELESHRHHLEELVQSRTLELAAARDAAEAANRSKAEFLANMSHEIRSPLNAILGLAYLLQQAQLDHDALDMVRKIRTSGRSLLGIVNDILDVSKIEAGHLVIEQSPFQLGDVIDNLADSMGLAVGNKNIELIIGPLPAGISAVQGDALRLGQVLTNLTSNAIKFTTSGRVELHCELLSCIDDNIMLRFCVQDTGIGIAPELQNEVFSAFTQADSSTTRRFGGTGLGLTICRQLVHLMGGEIGLKSVPDQGSEFWFTLPLQQVPSADFSSPDMVHLDVLIADDSDVALKAASTVAESLGWRVSAVDSGEAALSHVWQRKGGALPNVVVLDWKMPGLDGLATARALRESVAEDECPIVIMSTAYALSSLANQPGAELVDAILNKPVTPSTFYNAVLEAQHRRAAHVDLPQALLQATTDGLAGVRVLVVDDSDINREVALRILREQGAIVTLAVDGQAALDWLLAHPDDVDLVLMDVQMPVMDGIEATRQLRRLPRFRDLPIVALTAGAFKSQQEAAHAAGMTDFISKPFDVPSTIALIQRLRRPSTVPRVTAPPVETHPPTLHLDPKMSPEVAVMDVAQGLKIWKDMPSYRDYLRRFVQGYGHAVDVMNASLAADDVAAAAALAHKLSGVAANLALPETHRLAGEAERMLAKGYDFTQALARLDQALERAVAAIDHFAPFVAAADASGAVEVPVLEDRPDSEGRTLETLLIELLAALDTDNPAPAQAMLLLLAKQVPLQELSSIAACVQGFDFRGAEAGCFRLASERGISLKE